MVRATNVFTPTDVPTLTYVERDSRDFEADLRNAFNIPKMIVSISGPSKSGKTVLVTKAVAPENLINIYGATINTADDLWSNVLTWMGGPIERTETERFEDWRTKPPRPLEARPASRLLPKVRPTLRGV